MSLFQGASGVVIQGGTQVTAAAGSNITINQGIRGGGSTVKDLAAAAAQTAMHDSAARFDAPRCHQNTRTKYLDNLELWMLGQGEVLEGKRFIWLYGGAGAGKSAIMQSLVERCAKHSLVLGSFFFSRTDTSRNYAEVLIPTLAYQVACDFPEVWAVLEPVINQNPLIFAASLRTQAYELLVRPVLYLLENGTMDDIGPRCRVFIIDGLDECSDPQKQMLIIREITSILCDHHVPVSFLIASRPELAIISALEKENQLLPMLTSISLDDDDDSRSDIRQFVEDSFQDILDSHPWRHHITLPWPNPLSIDQLVGMSSGHFIYAATAMKYIASAKEHPERALKVVEGLQISRTESPFAQLDALYIHILSSAQYSHQVLAIFRHCYLSSFSQTVAELSWILGISQEDVSLFLNDAQSLVSLSVDSLARVCIMPKHASLQDFFLDESRSQTLYISRENYHASFLERYFKVLDNTLQVPASLSLGASNREIASTMEAFVGHLSDAIGHSQDADLLRSLISQHSADDVWDFCVETLKLIPTISTSEIREFASLSLYIYVVEIRASKIIDDTLYFRQFQMYIQLALDNINELAQRKPQYRMIPALVFSTSRAGLSLAIRLLANWSRQFRINDSYGRQFWEALTIETDGTIDTRSFQAISRMPQKKLSWSVDLAITMKIILQQLIHLPWPGPTEILHSRASPHRQWLRRHKAMKKIALGSPKLSSVVSRGIVIVRHNEQGEDGMAHRYGTAVDFLLSCWRRVLTVYLGAKMGGLTEKCCLLLKAVIFYLGKSDCTGDVARLARKSLPKVALWYPKLMKRARAEMDAYVRRWDESPDGLFERAQSLSINNVD